MSDDRLVLPLQAATEYSVAEGMSQNSALALARDDDGFLWIGTEDGLNRFDGYEFRIYRPSDHDATATAASFIRDIAVAGQHLFLATNGGGLAIFDRTTEHFRTLDVADGLPANHFNALDLARPGTLYLASRTGLVRLDWQGDPMTAKFTVTPIVVGSDPPRTDLWELRRGPAACGSAAAMACFVRMAPIRCMPSKSPAPSARSISTRCWKRRRGCSGSAAGTRVCFASTLPAATRVASCPAQPMRQACARGASCAWPPGRAAASTSAPIAASPGSIPIATASRHSTIGARRAWPDADSWPRRWTSTNAAAYSPDIGARAWCATHRRIRFSMSSAIAMRVRPG
ncbi:MAG: hypothetical protein IPO66_05075 [Rhodanobacteraceae bacterium]|nr:hypothetical protein [Rhodanobacteraceae bacterium]